MIVDVIDMSTTAEALWEEGVLEVFGAAVDGCRVPVKVDPEMMGYLAGQAALARSCGVVVVAEPRVATEEERFQRCRLALAGLERAGVRPEGIYPNLGAETVKQFTARNKVALLVTDTGGAAFDAAWQAGATVVTTATVARTMGRRGQSPALAGCSAAWPWRRPTVRALPSWRPALILLKMFWLPSIWPTWPWRCRSRKVWSEDRGANQSYAA